MKRSGLVVIGVSFILALSSCRGAPPPKGVSQDPAPQKPSVDRKVLAANYIKEGNVFYAGGEYDKALSAYNKAIQPNPKSALAGLAHYKRAKAYYKLGKYAQCVAGCDKAISIDPTMNRGIAYSLRGLAYQKAGRYSKAFSDYAKALAINPRDGLVRKSLKLIPLKASSEFFREGLKDFDIAGNYYNDRDYINAKAKLGEAFNMFVYSKKFDPDNAVAGGFIDFTKGALYFMAGKENIAAIKPSDSDYTALVQLRKAYYAIAMANVYIERGSPHIQNEAQKQVAASYKSYNKSNADIVKKFLPRIDMDGSKYIRTVDLEASALANFEEANSLMASGDNKTAANVLKKNEKVVSDLKRLSNRNADGILYLTSAYLRLNDIMPTITDRKRLKESSVSIINDLDACALDLGKAERGFSNKAFRYTCQRLSKDVSAMKLKVRNI